MVNFGALRQDLLWILFEGIFEHLGFYQFIVESMKAYSFCTLNIAANVNLASSYNNFLLDADCISVRPDIVMTFVDEFQRLQETSKVATMPAMEILIKIFEDRREWIFQTRDRYCSLCVDDQYEIVKGFYNDFGGFLNQGQIMEMLSPLISVLFKCKLVQRGFSILHASCVDLDGFAYAFTGPSGVGKSSRARKWVELLSAEWISGDRPAIEASTGTVYGVPWDGKEAVYRNIKRPLDAILKVTRSETTSVREMAYEEKFQLLCEQTFIPMWDPELAGKAMHSIKQLIYEVPILELQCDITDESTYKAHDMIIETINAWKERRR